MRVPDNNKYANTNKFKFQMLMLVTSFNPKFKFNVLQILALNGNNFKSIHMCTLNGKNDIVQSQNDVEPLRETNNRMN